MKRICENCKRKIQPKENYFEVKEFLNKKEISIKYVHKKCQDDYDNRLKNSLQVNQMAQQFIKNANQFLKNMGGVEVVTIK